MLHLHVSICPMTIKYSQICILLQFMFPFQYITVHLSFLQFVLQEGVLYLSWHRARDIWDVLIASNASSDWDKQVGVGKQGEDTRWQAAL